MRFIYAREVKRQAVSAIKEHRPDYRRLVFLHAAVSSAFLLIVSLIGLVINGSLADVQGLDGLATAGMLKSAYTACMLIGNMLLPFWEMGILYTSIRVVRRQDTSFSMLRQGFRRFMPLIGHWAMLMLILFVIAMACFNILITPFLCMPMPEELRIAAESLDYTDMAQIEAFQAEYSQEMMRYTMPFAIVFACVFGIIALILSYRFCMCRYLLLEDNRAGVMASFGISSRMTKGERKNLFLLDLSFWWYHLSIALISMLVYVPDVLKKLNVAMPVSYETASFIAYLGYLVLYLVLAGLFGAYYQTSMARAYETLRMKLNPEEGEKTAY